MKFNELFNDERGIFADVFQAAFPELYTAIFGDDAPRYWDAWCVLKYGDKLLIDKVTEDTYTNILSSIIAVNGNKWKKVVSLLAKEYDVLNPTTSTTESTRTVDTTTTNDNERTDAQKNFNDETFNDDARSKHTDNGTRQDNDVANSITKGLGNSVLFSTAIQKEKELRDNEYRQKIAYEIVNNITLQIY